MAHQRVYPRTELIVGGRFLVALESSNTHGYRNPSAGMTARVRPDAAGFTGAETIAIRRGYRSAASLRQRFGGTLNANSLRWAPQGVAFTGNGPLVRAQEATGIEDLALVPHGPDDRPTDERYAAAWIDATDGTIVAGLLALCGCPIGDIADTGTRFATLAPSVQSRYAVRLASDQPPWQLIEEIDRITGCRTFDGPDGRVYRIVASGLPSGSAARTYAQGADFKGEDASREFSSAGVYNKVTVTGQSGILADGTPYSIVATRTKDSPYVPSPPGTREYTFHSDLIETEELAGAVAARLLADLGRRKESVALPLTKGDPNVAVGMTVAVVSAALGLTAATLLRVVEVQDRDGAAGYQTTLVLEGGAAAEGTDPNQAPIPAIAVEIELETDANGDPLAVVRFDSSGSMDPDGSIALREWDGDPVVPTPIGDGTTAVAVYSPLPDSPPPAVTLTVQDDLGKRASLTVAVVATADNAYTRELWLACGASLDYTEDQDTWVTYPVAAAVIAEQAGDEYQLAAGDDGAARRVLADGDATALGALSGVTAFFVSRDRKGAETGVAWAAASDGRVWRSVDKGLSWGAVAALPNGGRCNAIEESPYASGDVYAGGGNILYHSYDAGASWQPFYTHPNADYLITRIASGIAAGATDDPADDAPVLWLGFSGPSGATEPRVVERGGALAHTLPTGAATPLDIVALTISLDAERLLLADPGDDGGRIWTAPTLTGGDLTPQPAYDAVKVEYGTPRHAIRDGRFPIAWGVSVDMAWKTTDEGGSFHPVRAIVGAGRSGRMVGYGRLRPAIAAQPGLFYASAAGEERALWLWNGTGNDDPPHNWQIVAFDDSAWLPSITSGGGGSPAVPADALPVWANRDGGSRANGEAAAFRRMFTLPTGAVTSATLTVNVDNVPLAIYLNGVYLGGRTLADYLTVTDMVFDVAALLLPGHDNVIAIHGTDHPLGGNVWAAYTLQINGGTP